MVRKMTQIPIHECYFLCKIIATQNTQKKLASLNAGGLSKKFKIYNIWSKDISRKNVHADTIGPPT